MFLTTEILHPSGGSTLAVITKGMHIEVFVLLFKIDTTISEFMIFFPSIATCC